MKYIFFLINLINNKNEQSSEKSENIIKKCKNKSFIISNRFLDIDFR